MMGELPPLVAPEVTHTSAEPDISRVAGPPLPHWEHVGFVILGAIGFVLTLYVLIKAWRDRSK